MNLLQRVYEDCGIIYSAALSVSFVGVLATQVALLTIARQRWTRWFAVAIAVIPLLVGLVGTLDGYFVVNQMIPASSVNPTRAEFEAGYAAARTTAYVGAVLSAVLGAVAAAPLLWPRKKR
jgi:hypothetical protein